MSVPVTNHTWVTEEHECEIDAFEMDRCTTCNVFKGNHFLFFANELLVKDRWLYLPLATPCNVVQWIRKHNLHIFL